MIYFMVALFALLSITVFAGLFFDTYYSVEITRLKQHIERLEYLHRVRDAATRPPTELPVDWPQYLEEK